MTNPTPLSPVAEAVWDSFCQVVEDHGPPRLGLSAALRAAADQVFPAASPFDRALCSPFAGQFRSELLAIAAELEADRG